MRVNDPVCGMSIDPQRAAGSFEHNGQTYFFCSLGCREKFKVDPERYLAPKPSTPIGINRAEHATVAISRDTGTSRSGPGRPRSVEYTCPMHPEIVSDAPGSCPICGMALEPRTMTLDEETNPELVDMTRRFWVSVALAVPLFGIAMSEFLPGNPIERIASMRVLVWIELVLATPVVVWGGWPFFVRFWQSIINRSLNMFTLIGLGVAVAYIYSVM